MSSLSFIFIKGLAVYVFVLFALQQTLDHFFGTQLLSLLSLSSWPSFQVWQLLTYIGPHASVFQLFFNGIAIISMALELQPVMGSQRFQIYCMSCVLGTGLIYEAITAFLLPAVSPLIGSAPLVYGLLVAYAIYFAEREIVFMMLFPMKAKHLVWVFALMEFMTTLYADAINSLIQLSSMGLGFLVLSLMLVMKKSHRTAKVSAGSSKLRSKRAHLKLVVQDGSLLDHSDDDPKDPKRWH